MANFQEEMSTQIKRLRDQVEAFRRTMKSRASYRENEK